MLNVLDNNHTYYDSKLKILYENLVIFSFIFSASQAFNVGFLAASDDDEGLFD